MKKFLLFSCLFCSMHISFAQVDPMGDFNKHVVANWKGDYIRIAQYRVKGTPYLYGESFPGSINYKGGKVFKDSKILYDLYNQKAGIDEKNEIFEADDMVEEFSIVLPEKYGSQQLLFRNSSFYGEENKGFFNIVVDGEKISLLKSYKIKLSTDPANPMDKDIKIFDQYFDYYLYSKSEQKLAKIKLKEKDVANFIKDAPFVKKQLNEQYIDLTKESGVKKLIIAYNNN